MDETTRTMTAKEAAGIGAINDRIRRGEVRVHLADGASVYELAFAMEGRVRINVGSWGWMYRFDYAESFGPDELLTVTDIPEAEQDENSPANVERLKVRIAALEAEIARLRAELDARPRIVTDAPGVATVVSPPAPGGA